MINYHTGNCCRQLSKRRQPCQKKRSTLQQMPQCLRHPRGIQGALLLGYCGGGVIFGCGINATLLALCSASWCVHVRGQPIGSWLQSRQSLLSIFDRRAHCHHLHPTCRSRLWLQWTENVAQPCTWCCSLCCWSSVSIVKLLTAELVLELVGKQRAAKPQTNPLFPHLLICTQLYVKL